MHPHRVLVLNYFQEITQIKFNVMRAVAPQSNSPLKACTQWSDIELGDAEIANNF